MIDLKNGPSLVPAEPCLSDDLLRGAEQIAEFIFGDKTKTRVIYHIASTSRLPHFKLGAVLCARKSQLLAWIADQEQRNANKEQRNANKEQRNANKEQRLDPNL